MFARDKYSSKLDDPELRMLASLATDELGKAIHEKERDASELDQTFYAIRTNTIHAVRTYSLSVVKEPVPLDPEVAHSLENWDMAIDAKVLIDLLEKGVNAPYNLFCGLPCRLTFGTYPAKH